MLLDRIITYILNPIVYLLIGIAVIVFLQGAIEFIAKANDPEGRKNGQRHLIWGIVGLTVIASAYAIMSFIQNSLVVLFK
ncbi:MAG TPA: hypothetical protein VJH94_05620 [Candidatus Paceibacterota bacterium]